MSQLGVHIYMPMAFKVFLLIIIRYLFQMFGVTLFVWQYELIFYHLKNFLLWTYSLKELCRKTFRSLELLLSIEGRKQLWSKDVTIQNVANIYLFQKAVLGAKKFLKFYFIGEFMSRLRIFFFYVLTNFHAIFLNIIVSLKEIFLWKSCIFRLFFNR